MGEEARKGEKGEGEGGDTEREEGEGETRALGGEKGKRKGAEAEAEAGRTALKRRQRGDHATLLLLCSSCSSSNGNCKLVTGRPTSSKNVSDEA